MTVFGQREGMSNLQKGLVVGLAPVATSAAVNSFLAAKAEIDNSPIGKFVEVDGVCLHDVELGTGEPVVSFHGKSDRATLILTTTSGRMLTKVPLANVLTC